MCYSVTILIILVLSPYVTRAAGNTCKSDQWSCRDGGCTSLNNVCDGASDCSDNSDETLPFCARIPPKKSNVCVLPPYPQHGIYEVEDLPNAQPGQSLASFVLTVKCRKGYGVVDPYGDGSGTQKVYCVNGKWQQNMPKCERFCKLDRDPSIRYMCYVPGNGIEVCKTYVQPGTTVDPVCNSPVYYSNELLPNMKCLFGIWNYVALCKAECGRVTPGGAILVIDGTQAKRGELPWHVGIYRKTIVPYIQICGGSIVSNNLVISAAHCFWSDTKKRLPAADFGVAAGKVYRSWDSEADIGAQRSNVKEIRIPSLFEGEAANFQEDIALLTLADSFTFTTYIRPVCLDFGSNFDSLQLQHGKLGKVAGWGLTAANGRPSQVLRVVEMPFIGVETCISTLPPSFREYLTGDKFCAGYTNGTALCKGDSGGGLAFPGRERGVERYFLRGIVSAAPTDDNKLCNDRVYTTFTKITKHQEFIKEAFTASAKKICPPYYFQCADGSCVDPEVDCDGKQDCSDGSDESADLCGVGNTTENIFLQQPENTKPMIGSQTPPQDQFIHFPGVPTKEPSATVATMKPSQSDANSEKLDSECEGGHNLPWSVAIYNTREDILNFICSGILISHYHVITVAHQMNKYKDLNVLKQITVKLGLYKADNFTGDTSITRNVISVAITESYESSSPSDDISILTLDRRVEFTQHFISAACLWKETSVSRAAFVLYSGWHHTANQDVRRMFNVDKDICRNNSLQNLNLDRILCVESLLYSEPYGDGSGSGVYFSDDKKWKLRGVLSLILPCLAEEDKCRSGRHLVYADLLSHLPWIRKILSETKGPQ